MKKKSSIKTVALVYTRVSTEQQALGGVGLDTQEAKCREHATNCGWEVQGVFSDNGISGLEDVQNRPGLAQVLEQAQALEKAKVRVIVVVYSLSRLTRRMKTLCDLLDEQTGAGLLVSSVTEPFDTSTPSGRALVGMLGVFAQLEADLAAERTKDALAEMKSQGKQLGRRFSYQLAPQSVAIVHELKNQGLSLRQILAELQRRQIPSPTGKNWHLASIRRVLQQKVE